MYTYKATCTYVVDGDTVDLRVDCGFHISMTLRFRILGIDTPELRRGTDEEKAAGRAARERVAELLLTDEPDLTVKTLKADSFGRWLASIFIHGIDEYLGEILLREGHAVPYKK